MHASPFTTMTQSGTAAGTIGVVPCPTILNFDVQDCRNHLRQGAKITSNSTAEARTPAANHGGIFPLKLHDILNDAEQKGFKHIISWAPHGQCFRVHRPKAFVKRILRLYYHHSKLTSFQRQLRLYGFRQMRHGPDRGSYYHEYFLRGQPKLTRLMVRVPIKGSSTRITPTLISNNKPKFNERPNLLSDKSLQSSMSVVPSRFISGDFLASSPMSTALLDWETCSLLPKLPAAEQPAIPSSLVHDFKAYSTADNSVHSLPLPLLSMSKLADHVKKHVYGCDYFQQLLNGCTNPTAEDLVEELFFEDPIDRNMITDFCLEWTPNIRDIASQLTLDANFLLAFK